MYTLTTLFLVFITYCGYRFYKWQSGDENENYFALFFALTLILLFFIIVLGTVYMIYKYLP